LAALSFIPNISSPFAGSYSLPEEIKFEGNPEGPAFVHSRAGMPIETVEEHADPAENCFVRFGGTLEECQAFVTRG